MLLKALERRHRDVLRGRDHAAQEVDVSIEVAVVDRVRHRRYGKTLQKTSHLYAHDEANDASEGDRVRIAETRPLSKLKHWRVVEVLERAR